MQTLSTKTMPQANKNEERLSLSQAAHYLLEECRMVLPGIQALFGFQLIAVFNQRFDKELSDGEQICHLFAIGFVALAVVLVMTPAAYHRTTGTDRVTRDFIKISTQLLLFSMFPLATGIALDFYLIACMILHNVILSVILAGILFLVFIVFWFVFPHFAKGARHL